LKTPLNSGSASAIFDVIDFLTGLKEGGEESVWGRIVEKLCVALGAEAGTYYVYLPAQRQLMPRYSLGQAAPDIGTTAVDARTGICGWVAVHREPVIVENAYTDARFLREVDELTGFKTQSVLAVPLMNGLDLVGVVELFNKREGPFTAEDLKLAQAICKVASQTLRVFQLEGMVDKVTSHNASILENLGGGFIAIDLHGRMILCNPSAKQILGLAPGHPMNQPIEQSLIACPELGNILMDTLATRKTAKRQDLWWKKAGETRVLGYSTLLIQDPHGRLAGAGITFQDITNVKERAK
jgi:adenylate cyclase